MVNFSKHPMDLSYFGGGILRNLESTKTELCLCRNLLKANIQAQGNETGPRLYNRGPGFVKIKGADVHKAGCTALGLGVLSPAFLLIKRVCLLLSNSDLNGDRIYLEVFEPWALAYNRWDTVGSQQASVTLRHLSSSRNTCVHQKSSDCFSATRTRGIR
ncbi:uncharacterized protein LOC144381814 [Halichoerus grypus]